MEMSAIRRAIIVCAAAGLSLCASLALASPSWGWGVKKTSIGSGFDNPRDLAFGPDGHLYVAEAGHGGSDCVKAKGPGGEEESACVGPTGGIGRIDSPGVHHRVLSGIASLGEESG